jgi:hypothetical protein
LTTVSLAKVAYYLNVPKEQRGLFSMADVKTQYINKKMLELIISECGDDPNSTLIKSIEKIRPIILDFGRIHRRRA